MRPRASLASLVVLCLIGCGSSNNSDGGTSSDGGPQSSTDAGTSTDGGSPTSTDGGANPDGGICETLSAAVNARAAPCEYPDGGNEIYVLASEAAACEATCVSSSDLEAFNTAMTCLVATGTCSPSTRTTWDDAVLACSQTLQCSLSVACGDAFYGEDGGYPSSCDAGSTPTDGGTSVCQSLATTINTGAAACNPTDGGNSNIYINASTVTACSAACTSSSNVSAINTAISCASALGTCNSSNASTWGPELQSCGATLKSSVSSACSAAIFGGTDGGTDGG